MKNVIHHLLISGLVGIFGIFVVCTAVFGQDAPAPVASPADYASATALSRVFRDASQKVLPATVKVISHARSARDVRAMNDQLPFRLDPGSRLPGDGMGTGVILDPKGIIMTNYHVVKGAREVDVELYDGRTLRANRIRFDDRTDLAVLWVDSKEELPYAKFGDSDVLDIGDWVLAIGNPFDLDSTVSAGIISAKGRSLKRIQRGDFLQTDAAINPGNSGGPLIDLKGEVVGINTAITSMTGTNQGIGFAIPAENARWVYEQLLVKTSIQRAWLGVETISVDAETAKKLGVQPRVGVMIDMLIGRDTPADRAKLLRQDVILEFDGQKVNTPAELQRLTERAEVALPHKILLVRNKEKRNVELRLDPMPAGGDSARSLIGNSVQVYPDTALGLSVIVMSPEMANRMNMRGRKGLLVFDVFPESRAEKAGILKGMVIEKIDDKTIETTSDYAEVRKTSSLSEGIVFETILNGNRKTITIKL